jgi:pimeloyl-ACP methyl ester carboxylesterase
MTDDVTVAAQRASCRAYTWSPHRPRSGRLHRTDRRWFYPLGLADRSEAYGRAFCAALPLGAFETIAGAGHFPHIEQPKEFAARALVG